MSELPSSAKIVIVGGGIVGCSVAYHLGKMGLTDVILLEQGKLTSGSTWHAAGLVGQLRTSANITQLLGYSVQLYDRLEQETGLATGWKRNGGLRLACNPERWTEVNGRRRPPRPSGSKCIFSRRRRPRICGRSCRSMTSSALRFSPLMDKPHHRISPCRWPRAHAARALPSEKA